MARDRQLNFYAAEMTVLTVFKFESQLMQKPGPRDIIQFIQ